jgi:hypothetical protein
VAGEQNFAKEITMDFQFVILKTPRGGHLMLAEEVLNRHHLAAQVGRSMEWKSYPPVGRSIQWKSCPPAGRNMAKRASLAQGHLSPTSMQKWEPDPCHFVGVTPLPTTVIEAMFRLRSIKEMKPDWHQVGFETLQQVPIEAGVALPLYIKKWVPKGTAVGVLTLLTVPREHRCSGCDIKEMKGVSVVLPRLASV